MIKSVIDKHRRRCAEVELLTEGVEVLHAHATSSEDTKKGGQKN